MHTYKVNTGLEESLQREIADLKLKNEELKTNMALLTDENLKFREANNLQRDQIAMFQRRFSQSKPKYPFKEGDLYYVLNQLDGTWIESVWDDESERLHDNSTMPNHPHKVYFTVDQKHVLDKFNPEADLKEDMEDQTKLVDDLRYHINAFMAAVEETIDL